MGHIMVHPEANPDVPQYVSFSVRTANGRRGGILLNLLWTALAVVVVAGIGIVYMLRTVRVNRETRAGSERVSIDTPVGNLKIFAREHSDSNRSGVPVYPGSTRSGDGGSATLSWSSSDGDHQKTIAVAGEEFFTPDSATKVLKWYRERLPGWILVRERDRVMRLEMNKDGSKTMVNIREKSDGTHIAVATVGTPAPN